MSYSVIVKLKKRFSEKQISDKFKSRQFVGEIVDEKYPQFISFQLSQAKCESLDNFKEGQDVEVHFNLRGRIWTNPQGEDVYFNTLEAWKIESKGSSEPQTSSQPNSKPYVSDNSDDLPF